MRMMIKMILLVMLAITIGCAKVPSSPESFALNPNFERDLETRYQELRKQGMVYVKADPQYEESRRAINKAYRTKFLQDMVDCQAVSLGLQFLLLQGTEQEFCESLLAVSAEDSHEFYQMFLWYEDQRDSAKKFLRLLEEDLRLAISVDRTDAKQLDIVSKELGITMCSPEITLEILQEFGMFF